MDGPGDFRVCHLLERNKGYTAPHSFVFVDTESMEHPHPEIESKRIHTFRLGVASYLRLDSGRPTRRDQIEFRDVKDFWTWLHGKLDRRRPLYLFAHNLGFDLTMLGFWDLIDQSYFYLADDLWPIRNLANPTHRGKRPWRGVLVTEDAPTIVAVRQAGCTLKCIDTRNYFPQSLAKLGERVGIGKLPLPRFEDCDEAWFKRCRVDVQIIEALILDLIRWWKGGKYGTWRNTAPGLAWNAYRHEFMDHPIEISGHKKAVDLERMAYYGGECRCFFVGKVRGPVFHLDTRSLYPSVMRANLYPCKLAGYIPRCPLNRLLDIAKEHAFACECVIKSESRTYPVRVDGRTRYALGTYHTWLPGPEALAAYQAGDLVELGALAYYDQADLFSRYVDHFWPLREQAIQEGNETYALFYKLLLNALPGKFAQRQWRWEEDMTIPSPCPWGEWWHYDVDRKVSQLYRSVALYTQKSYRGGEANDSFPLIAAYVTSYARLRMKTLREIAGTHCVYYQDTDSLHTNQLGFDRLAAQPQLTGDGLGQLYKKGTHDEAQYYGLKHYTLDGKMTYGGAPKIESPSERRPSKTVKFTKLGAAIGSGIPRSVTVSEHSLVPSTCHPDGQPDESGWVIPVTLPDSDPFLAFGQATGKGWLDALPE